MNRKLPNLISLFSIITLVFVCSAAVAMEKRPLPLNSIEALLKAEVNNNKEVAELILELGVSFKVITENDVLTLESLEADKQIFDAILSVISNKTNILYVRSEQPNVSLYINGMNRGKTPLWIIDLPPGIVNLVSKLEEYNDHEKKILINQNKFVDVFIDLEPADSTITPISSPIPIASGDTPALHSIISSISIFPKEDILSGKIVEVKVKLNDSVNDSDNLIYTWSSDKGYFESRKSVEPVNYWTAPFSYEENIIINVSVSSQDGNNDEMDRSVSVKPDWRINAGKYTLLRTLKNHLFNGYACNVVDVAFDSKNFMYVLDHLGKCIRVFKPNGEYLRTLCKGILNVPNKILIEDDKIYVIYNNNKSVERYDIRGNREVTYSKSTMSGNYEESITEPIALAVGKKGELYVIDGNIPDIVLLEKDAKFIKRFGQKLDNPVAISVDNKGFIYVCDAKKREILIYDSNLQFLKNIEIGDKVLSVIDMYLDKRSNLFFLLDSLSQKIITIDSSGNEINKVGTLENPNKISGDRLGNIYTTNKKDNYVCKFILTELDTHRYYGKFGTNPFTKNICDIAVDSSGSVFLLNEVSGNVIKVDRNGWELNKFGGIGRNVYGKFTEPISIVSGKEGEYIYVLDKPQWKNSETVKNQVLEFSNMGIFKRIVAGNENKDGGLAEITDIDSDREGNLYIFDEKKGAFSVRNHSGKVIMEITTDYKTPPAVGAVLGYLPKFVVDLPGKTVYVSDKKRVGSIKIEYQTASTVQNTFGINPPKGLSLLKINNYKRLLRVTGTILGKYSGKIDVYNLDGVLEQTLSGKDSFKKIKDIEVDDIGNLYVLSKSGEVYIYKQSRLLSEDRYGRW
ncbi:MAG: PEGA domain-containing protein [Candidatus Anammoxibacter sp.]